MTRINLMAKIGCGSFSTLKKFLATSDFVILNEKNEIIELKENIVFLKKEFKNYKSKAWNNRLYSKKKGRPKKIS